MGSRMCINWDEDACRIDDVLLQRLGDFFKVTGKVTNRLKCTLPHLQLRLGIYNLRGKKIMEDIFHITDRQLKPNESCLFKMEGEWKRGMKRVKVSVFPCKKESN